MPEMNSLFPLGRQFCQLPDGLSVLRWQLTAEKPVAKTGRAAQVAREKINAELQY